jgi:hypothetical protein
MPPIDACKTGLFAVHLFDMFRGCVRNDWCCKNQNAVDDVLVPWIVHRPIVGVHVLPSVEQHAETNDIK